MERVADNLYDVGLNGQGLEKLEQNVELMEKHWREFCMEVQPFKSYLGSKTSLVFQFPKVYYRCELAAIEAGEKEKAQLYRKKSLEAAGAISKNYQRIMLESGRKGAEDLAAMIELIKNLGS